MTATREQIVSRTLVVGIYVSGALMVIGFVLYAAQPSWYSAAIPVADHAWLSGLFSQSVAAVLLNPFVYLYAGIFALMFTPILRLFVTGWTFYIERDWRYVSITLVVLTVIGISIVLSLIR